MKDMLNSEDRAYLYNAYQAAMCKKPDTRLLSRRAK